MQYSRTSEVEPSRERSARIKGRSQGTRRRPMFITADPDCGITVSRNITDAMAEACTVPGQDAWPVLCRYVMDTPVVLVQPDKVRKYLAHYGHWSPEDLRDDASNTRRLLWLACGDFVDGQEPDVDSGLGARRA